MSMLYYKVYNFHRLLQSNVDIIRKR